MRSRWLAAALTLAASAACAAVDVNQASLAELESVRGIGPDIAARILAERQKRLFQDWQDLARRVRGVGGSTAARFSAEGLTVNGAPFGGKASASAAFGR
jgi:competence protein ComEA